MSEPMSYRMKQTARGLEALQAFADFLESRNGQLTISVNEENYSSGSHGKPDIICKETAYEVKRVEFLLKHRFRSKERIYAHLNSVSILHESWNGLKEWCEQNKKALKLVVALSFGRQPFMFVEFSQAQIDKLQQDQIDKKWFQLNSWKILLHGKVLK